MRCNGTCSVSVTFLLVDHTKRIDVTLRSYTQNIHLWTYVTNVILNMHSSQALITDLRTLGTHIISCFKPPIPYLEPLRLSSFNDSLRSHYLYPLGIIHQIFCLSVNTQQWLKIQLFTAFLYSNWRYERTVLLKPLMDPQYVFAVVFHPASSCVCLRLSQWVCVGGGKQVIPWLITAFSS